MRIIQHINYYMLSDDPDDIHWSDYVWMYGFYSFIILLPVIVWLYIR